jgi:hypothetical protein
VISFFLFWELHAFKISADPVDIITTTLQIYLRHFLKVGSPYLLFTEIYKASSLQTQIDCGKYYAIGLGEVVGLGEREEGLPNRSAITLYTSNS